MNHSNAIVAKRWADLSRQGYTVRRFRLSPLDIKRRAARKNAPSAPANRGSTDG